MGENGEEQNEQMGILLNENRKNKTFNKNKERNKERPWKIMIQNMGGLVSENSKEKVDLLREYVKEDNIMLMNLTETWLDSTIKDVVEIDGYNIFRGDRNDRKRGGTAIYVHDNIEANLILEMSNGTCDMVAVEMPDVQVVNIVIYRPPGTKSQEFNPILSEIQKIFQKLEKPDPTIILSGDLNFPFVKWKRLSDNSCSYEYKTHTNATTDDKQQFEKLLEICNNQCMLQIIEEPTREENTLDLVFTNETGMVTMIEVNKSKNSDHDIVEISTNYITKEKDNNKEIDNTEDNILKSINFRAKTVNWKNIIGMIEETSWNQEFVSRDAIKSGEEFLDIITKSAKENAPMRSKQGKGSKIPRERKKLHNRIKMLKREKHRAYSNERKKSFERKILETEQKIIESKRSERLENEKQCIDSMKDNPRVFYSFINKQRNRRIEIGPFKKDETFIYNGKEISNSLKTEFTSQMNERSNRGNPRLFEDIIEGDLSDIEFDRKDIEDAIDDLDENSSAGPDGIPAIFLKKTKKAISKPLALLLRKSIDEGKIPEIFKMAYITPIHKGGSKQNPAQYRPVSLTSHIMKVFERVIKKKIMAHLIKNDMFNKSQHGFVPGRNTQTQLLSHLDDIYETLTEGKRLDTIFLDFAKAFDKVDHEILLEKVKKHKISGKIGKWIKEFLSERKFRVVANGCMSDEGDVLSGVPQGTVLAAILFVIMISDIDEKIKECILRSFADDTRVSKKVICNEDKQLMQEDLNAIYKWAKDNKMQFNAGKFEQIIHGKTKNTSVEPYKSPSGDPITIKNTVKDLGVFSTNDLMFKEHMEKIVNSSKIVMGMLLRTFSTREKEPMLRMFNTYIRSKLEYCCIVWSPVMQKWIYELEKIQKSFTSKINGIEELDYHERLKKLNLYSLERRRERYMIIYGWQQLEGLKENVLKLTASETRRDRRIITPKIPNSANGKRLTRVEKRQIYNCPARKIQRLFNCIPGKIRNITKVTTDTFKRHLDEWLKTVPDQPRGGGYSGRVAAESNSIQHQSVTLRTRR